MDSTPWYIYALARGSVFYWGAGLLIGLILVRSKAIGLVRRIGFVMAVVLSLALIAISAAPLEYWMYWVWAAAIAAWLISPVFKGRKAKFGSGLLLLIMTVAAIAAELSYDIRPSLPGGNFHRLYVVGDSISAGIGAEHGKTWPVLLGLEHHVEVVDLSRAGSTIAEAENQVRATTLQDGLIFLEIGGNDMLGHVDATKFADDLERLVSRVEGPGRRLIMLELPLLPLDNGYGVVQRRVARRHGIVLIPRRFWVDILEAPGATVDGIHLSAAGQRQFAEMVWSFVGASLR